MSKTNYPYPKKQEAPLFLVSTKADTPILFKLKPYTIEGVNLKNLFTSWAAPDKATTPKKKESLKRRLKEQMLLLKRLTGDTSSKGYFNPYDALLKKHYGTKIQTLSTPAEFDLARYEARKKDSNAWKDPEEFWTKIFRRAAHPPVGTGNKSPTIGGVTINVPQDLFLPVRPGLTICSEPGLVGKPKSSGIEPYEGNFIQIVDTRVIPITKKFKTGSQEIAGGGLMVGVIRWFGTSMGAVTKGSRTYEIFPIEDLPLTHSMWIYPQKGPTGATNNTILHSEQERAYLEEKHPKGSLVRVGEDFWNSTLLGVSFAGKKRNHPLSSPKSTAINIGGGLRESFFPRRKQPGPKGGIVCEVISEPERNIANREYTIQVRSVKDPLKKFAWISSFEVRKEQIKIDKALKDKLLKVANSLIKSALQGKIFEPHAPSEKTTLHGSNPFDWYRETIKKKVSAAKWEDAIRESDKEAFALGVKQGAYFLWVQPLDEGLQESLPDGQSLMWSMLSDDQTITLKAENFESVWSGYASTAVQKKGLAWLTEKLKEKGHASGDAFEITLVLQTPLEIAVIKDLKFIDSQLNELRPYIGPTYDDDGNLTNYPGERDIHTYNMFLSKKYFEDK